MKKYEYNVPNLWGESLNRTIKKICKRLSESVPSLAKMEKTILTLPERRKEKEAQEKGEQLFEYDNHGNAYIQDALWFIAILQEEHVLPIWYYQGNGLYNR